MTEKRENNLSVGGLGFAIIATWILHEWGLFYLIFFWLALVVGSMITSTRDEASK